MKVKNPILLKLLNLTILIFAATLFGSIDVLADQHESVIDTGDTAWIITATALVLFMTIPGLALFYGGLVSSKNVVSALMHCFAICCLASVLWLFGGYSLAFTDGGDLNKYIGTLEKFLFNNVEWNALSGSIPENIGALSNLDSLYLSYNNFTGEIPASITGIDSLTYLALDNNILTGIIPEHIGSIDSLKYLNLDNNQLSGEIPQSIGDLKVLRYLSIYKNNLSGQIPENICNLYENDLGLQNSFHAFFHQNDLCPNSSGYYPPCIPDHHLGPQDCSP